MYNNKIKMVLDQIDYIYLFQPLKAHLCSEQLSERAGSTTLFTSFSCSSVRPQHKMSTTLKLALTIW
jgi:hypothetical protein